MSANHLQPSCYRAHLVGRAAAIAMLGAAARGVATTLQQWRQRRRSRRELARLDDRALRDIGLTRGDAEFLINKPFWRA